MAALNASYFWQRASISFINCPVIVILYIQIIASASWKIKINVTVAAKLLTISATTAGGQSVIPDLKTNFVIHKIDPVILQHFSMR